MAELSQTAARAAGMAGELRGGLQKRVTNFSVEAQIGQNVALQTKRKRSFQFCNPIL
jgi:hypothetical protein